MYAAGRLEGTAAAWWDAYTAANNATNTITWQEFRNKFRENHMPKGLMKLKRQEFLTLLQGGMFASETRASLLSYLATPPQMWRMMKISKITSGWD